MSPEHETMRELLQYPIEKLATSHPPAELRWMRFAQELIKEYEAELERLRERDRDAEFNDFKL